MQAKLKISGQKTAVLSGALIVLLIVAACIASRFLSGKGFYYPMAVMIIAAACVPFFVSFEKSRPSARELVVLACMSALAVASRAAFYALPTVKPLCAIVIIAAVSLGPQTGFICGVLSMFASNFIFGHGPWTVFQMLGMGSVGLIMGLIFHGREIRNNRILLALIGGIVSFAVYGMIVDISSVLMMSTDFSLSQILTIYASGLGYNLSHGITTAVILLIAGQVFIEKLDRIKTKFGMF